MNTADQKAVNYTGSTIAFGIVTLLAFITYVLSSHEIPEKNGQLFTAVLQTISNAVTWVLGFYFGTSLQSRKQSETNSELASAVNTALATDPVKAEKTVSTNPGQTAEVKATEQP